MSDNSVQIASVTFLSETVIQVQYSEEREYTPAAALMRSLVIDTEFLVEDEVETLSEAILDIIDKALLLIRNPPPTKAPPQDNDE